MIDIKFVAGIERRPLFPKQIARFIEKSRLEYRFAIIQDTYLEGCPDMYFDELLWRRLIEFIVDSDQDGDISIIEQGAPLSWEGIDLRSYLAGWNKIDPADRVPPWLVLHKRGSSIDLVMVTEYWLNFGGPDPYHDSYTYSVFSNHDLRSDIPSYLIKSPEAERWKIASEILQPAE